MLNSYLLYIVERAVDQKDLFICYETTFEISHINGYKDALWLTIITFLTVGFGDFYPFSNFG